MSMAYLKSTIFHFPDLKKPTFPRYSNNQLSLGYSKDALVRAQWANDDPSFDNISWSEVKQRAENHVKEHRRKF